MPKRAVISVINDLVTDQRIAKTADVLQELGFEVIMVGRLKHDSPSMPSRTYTTDRMRLLWEKGPVFYIEYTIRLFFFLLFRKTDLLISNDLDTLLPNYLIHKLKNIPIVFDSHEYFTQTPELVHRPFVQKVWKSIERFIVPKLKSCITVSEGISQLFEKEYNTKFTIVRNIPKQREVSTLKSRNDLNLPTDKSLILLQGSGINVQRGAEEAVMAMKYISHAVLLIIGGGDVMPILKKMVADNQLQSKVIFIGRLSPEVLTHYTANADIGLTLDKDTNINYHFSLPNKLFDYIHAGLPILASNLPEIRNIVTLYQIGEFIDNHKPEHIANQLNTMLLDKNKMEFYKNQTHIAAQELNWEKEKIKLIDIFQIYA